MSEWLLNWFQKRRPDASREAIGSFAGTVGLGCNILLFGFKLLVGLLSASVSVIADAVNNLTDAGSSIVTMLGFRLASKPADQEHPYGHSRMENLSGAVIALVILVLGGQLLASSVKKILHPVPAAFSAATFVVLAGAVAAKLWMMLFYRRAAARINSASLRAAADDSRNDIASTGAVLAAAAVEALTGLKIDGWAGALVAVFILLSGAGILKTALSPLLGEAPSPELIRALEQTIRGFDGVLGLHDLLVHSYGPDHRFATAHVEMSAALDPMYTHGVLDEIEREVEQKLGVKLVIHLDPVVTDDRRLNELRERLSAAVREISPLLSIHDLRVSRVHGRTDLFFDVAVPGAYAGETEPLRRLIEAAVSQLDPAYRAVIEIDRNYQASIEG